MILKVGEINKLIVDRKTDLGFTLTDGEYDILLHYNQATRELEVNEEVEVFLFYDSKGRITATMHKPIMKVNEPNFTTVKDIVPGLGIFVDNNTPKDPLISLDDLPLDESLHPQVGDTVFCKLKVAGTKLIAKTVSPEEIKNIKTPTSKLIKGQKVKALVTKSGKEGVNLLTKDFNSIFVFYKHKRKDYRIGEEVEVTITNIKDDQTYNGTLLDNLVIAMEKDAKIILAYLEEHNGFMPFTSKSTLEDIETTFKMSKSAFKRGLGNLYKKQIIEFKEDGTYLTNKN